MNCAKVRVEDAFRGLNYATAVPLSIAPEPSGALTSRTTAAGVTWKPPPDGNVGPAANDCCPNEIRSMLLAIGVIYFNVIYLNFGWQRWTRSQ